jgi:hypothetical protein
MLNLIAQYKIQNRTVGTQEDPVKRPNLNFLVDAAAFAAFVLLTSTGVLMSYILPPGSGHFSTLWGMDRHEWGRIHFWIAVALMAFLGQHLLLHWRWIVGMVKGQPGEGFRMRTSLSVVGLLALIALSALPFLGRVEQGGEPPHKMRSEDHDKVEGYRIDGTMTLADIERLTGVPTAVILRELGLPADLPRDEQLGRLRRQYGFELQDVREVLRRQGK